MLKKCNNVQKIKILFAFISFLISVLIFVIIWLLEGWNWSLLFSFPSPLGIYFFLWLIMRKLIGSSQKLKKFVIKPYLDGEWNGELKSTFNNKTKKINIKIKQNLHNCYISLKTDESSSETIGSAIIYKKNEQYELWCRYQNEPKPEKKDENPMHNGFLMLKFEQKKEEKWLIGNYFTDRKTTGCIKIKKNNENF